MLDRDSFNPNFHLDHVLYTFALGLALGVLAGAVLIGLRRDERVVGVAGGMFGALLGVLTVLTTVNGSPLSVVSFRVRPYLAELLEAFSVAAAGLAGVVLAAGVLLLGRRVGPLAGPGIAVLSISVVSIASLAWLNAHTTRGESRHPIGTDTSSTVEATRLIDDLDVPTGLAIAANGDIAIVEHPTATVRIYQSRVSEAELRAQSRLPIGEGLAGLHVVFHPLYPSEPYFYVSSEADGSGRREMHVFRGRVEGASIQFVPVITGLPSALREERGDHFGSAMAFCGESFFLTVGDTEDAAVQSLDFGSPNVVRDQAQRLNSAVGKILRYEIEGAELEPAGLVDSAYPIYALGFRNPFGITCDPVTEHPVVAENGSDGHDQIRLVTPGSNHEWPLSLERDAFGVPLWSSGEVHVAPTGIAVRSAAERHEFLVSAFQSQGLYSLAISSDGEPGSVRLLREVEGGAFSIAAQANGCVLFTDASSLWRLEDGRCR